MILPDLADKSWLDEVRLHFDYLIHSEGDNAAREHHQEEKANRLANLVNKGPVYERAWCHSLVLACCAHIFQRPFKLSSLNGREALLGGGHQPLHSDWKGARGPINRVHACNGIWAIDDLTLTNGAPRLVPGSHLFPGRPEELLDEPAAPHPDQIVAQVPAGSVLMFNAHTWHGGTTNRSGERRRVLHAYYTAREYPQQQDQRRWLTDETRSRLSVTQRWLLDVD